MAGARPVASTDRPGWPALYGRAALGAIPGAGLLPFVGGRGSELPDARARARPAWRSTATRLAAYCKVCGFTLRETLPPTYPHVLAFPLQMRLMADGGFPFPLLGLVHLDNSITQHRPIGAGEPLDLAVRAEDLRPHPKGRAFSLIAEARVGGRARLGGAGHDPAARRRRPGRAAGPAAPTPRPRGRPRGHRMEARRRSRPPLRRRLRRPQPDPHARAQRQGPRLPARDRPRHVEPGALPGAAREPDPRVVQDERRLRQAAAAARRR